MSALDPVERLSRILAAENAALAQHDLQSVGSFLAEKNAACAGLADMRIEAAAARRLHELCMENRRLLARALAVQQRLIGLVATGMAKSDADGRYAASGRPNQSARAAPAAFLARA